MNLREYRHSDARALAPTTVAMSDEALQRIRAGGLAVTLCDGDRPVVAMGVAKLWRGVGEAWVAADFDAVRRYRMALLRHMVRGLDLLHEVHGFHRIQAMVLEDAAPACRLIEWPALRFRCEGRQVGYLPNGATALRYARVSNGLD